MAERIATPTAITAGVGTTYLGWTADEWSIISMVVGVAVSILTGAASLYFMWRRDRREQAALQGRAP